VSEQSVGIVTTGANEYVAAFTASQQADGKDRVIQLIAVVAGKIDESVTSPTRSVSSDDSLDMSTVSSPTLIGDERYIGVYIKHSEPDGKCLVTPLLCDNNDAVIGTLETKESKVQLPMASGSHYLSSCLSWEIMSTGAWKCFPHIYNLSDSNAVDVWMFTY
jgi:hypothetical protein